MLTVRAYAKVNLTLEALSKRDDGYHTIASVAQTIDLCDELRFAPSDRLTLRCSCAIPGDAGQPGAQGGRSPQGAHRLPRRR